MNLKLRNSLAAVLLLAAAAVSVTAQNPTRTVTLRPFEPAEELIYEAELSRGILRKLDVAEFRLRAQRSNTTKADAQANRNPEVLVLKCDIASKGFFP